METIIKANANHRSVEFKTLSKNGYKYVLEFGFAGENQTKHGYFCKSIEDARKAYKAHKNEGNLFNLVETGEFPKSIKHGWVK